MFITYKKFTLVLCLAALFTAGLFGQTVSSSLQGTVIDPASAVVPNAQVKVVGTDTGVTRTGTTETTGLFRFLDLEPGTYSITVTATGFKGYQQTSIVLAANETRDLGKVGLTIGSAGETVTVTAEDAYGNTITAYNNVVHFTSTDSKAVLPANARLASGVGTFSVTLKTAGSQTVTATDTGTPAITGTSGAIEDWRAKDIFNCPSHRFQRILAGTLGVAQEES